MDDARRPTPTNDQPEPEGVPQRESLLPRPTKPGPYDVESGWERVKRRFPKILARLAE